MSVTHVRRYRVEHQTDYRYEEPVTLSHHQLRLTPRPLPHQHSQACELALTPVPALPLPAIGRFWQLCHRDRH
jgi:hypothetical protein